MFSVKASAKKFFCGNIFSLCLLCGFTCIFDSGEIAAAPKRLSSVKIAVNTPSEHWLFSGVVTTEHGRSYAYYLMLRRDDNSWTVAHQLLDLQTDNIVFDKQFTKNSTQKKATDQAWHIGPALIQHNAINDSWVIGMNLSDKDKLNFRLNNVAPYKQGSKKMKSLPQHLKAATDMRLNGNLTIDGQDFFVTGKGNWFVHQWGDDVKGLSHLAYSRLFCSLGDDGAAFIQRAQGRPYALLESFKMNEKQHSGLWFILKPQKVNDDSRHWTLESSLTNTPLQLVAHQPITLNGKQEGETKLFVASSLPKNENPQYCFIIEHRV